MLTSFDYDKGYKKAVSDIIDILTKSYNPLNEKCLRSKKNIIEFLKLYRLKADDAIKCPKITRFLVNDKNKLIDIYFLGDK